MDNRISYYTTVTDTTGKTLQLTDVTAAVKTGATPSGNIVEDIAGIRIAKTKKERDKLKQMLPAVTFSGIFNPRRKDGLQHYSGLLCIDFDYIDNLQKALQMLKADHYTFLCFLSPSGVGIKVVVQTTATAETHAACFLSLEQYYLQQYGLQVDKACKDMTRLCFLSYDPDIYVNEQPEIYQVPEAPKAQPPSYTANGANVYDQVEHCVLQIEEQQLDITSGYENWLNIAFAMANQFGESGRGFFHRLSMYNVGYIAEEADRKYSNAVKTNTGKITIRSFFDLCKQNNINLHPEKAKKQPGNNAKKTEENPEKNEKIAEKNQEKTEKNQYGSGKQPKTGGGGAEITNSFIQVENYLHNMYDFRKNTVTGEVEYKEKSEADFKLCREENIYVHLQRNAINFSQNKLHALLGSDFVQEYDPFHHYFDNLPVYVPQKEQDHITTLCTYVTAKEQDRFNKHMKKMLVRTVACALEPGMFNKQAFILVHNKQNSGKSTFCRWLCPPILSSYYSETFNTDKDSMIALAENFIINLDEMASLQKFEINALKTAISKDNVKIRRPYDKRAELYPRRASFVGSTNDLEFLTDKTGNVRFLCFEIEKINFSYKTDLDINRIWAQAYHLYNAGFDYQLTSGEIQENEESNDNYQVSDPVAELLQKWYEPGIKGVDSFLSTTEVLEELRNKSTVAAIPIFNNKNIGSALRSLGFIQDKQGHNRRRGYWMKELPPPYSKPPL